MATNLWMGGTSADASVAANWSEGLPANGDDVIVPPYAGNGITDGMDAIGARTLKSFWVQDGFTKNIGSTSGFFQVDLSNSGATQFLFEGSSTLAKFHFIKTLANVSIDIRKTGVGNLGQPAFQMITNDVSTTSTNMGIVSVYSGEVFFGPEQKLCELGGLVVGSNSEESSPVVDMGVNCRDDTGDNSLQDLWVNSGVVNCNSLIIAMHQYGGTVNHTGGSIGTLNLHGGDIKLNNATGTAGGNVITKLNLRGGTFDNTENPTAKTITNADLYSGSIQDPLGKCVWTNAVVFKNKMTDVDFDFGPERTVTIA